MRSNCIAFAVALYWRRWLASRRVRVDGERYFIAWRGGPRSILIRTSRLGSKLPHVLFAEWRGGKLRVVHFVPNNAKVKALRAALPANIHLHFAMKANPLPAVVRHMVGLVDGLDVASIGEMEVALAAGAAADDVSFAGPGKTDAELERAAAAGITYEEQLTIDAGPL